MIDLGTGDGRSVTAAAAAEPETFVIGVDASADVLADIDVPTLVLHGTDDAVVDVSAGEYTAGKIAGAVTRWWEGVGHLPFVESSREFDTTLRWFAEQVVDGAVGRTER